MRRKLNYLSQRLSKRIVAILDKADEINYAKTLHLYATKLINSTFQSLFGPYFVNENHLSNCELVESVRVGYVGPTSKHYRDQVFIILELEM